jgi:hypothetical protein
MMDLADNYFQYLSNRSILLKLSSTDSKVFLLLIALQGPELYFGIKQIRTQYPDSPVLGGYQILSCHSGPSRYLIKLKI